MIQQFIEDLLVAHALLVFNCGGPCGVSHAAALIQELPKERIAAMWPARRSRSLVS